VNSPKSWSAFHLEEIEETPAGRFLAASWVWAHMGSVPWGTAMGQSHMGSMNTTKVSRVTPLMLDSWEPGRGRRGGSELRGSR
jgi:hypothetical protein